MCIDIFIYIYIYIYVYIYIYTHVYVYTYICIAVSEKQAYLARFAYVVNHFIDIIHKDTYLGDQRE